MSREEQDVQFGPVSVVWGCLTSDEGGIIALYHSADA